jgi:purine-binding chemotaxis protein CheW
MQFMNKRAFVLFSIDDQMYAVDVHAVRQVIRAVELTRVQNGPELLLGLLNMHGQIIPVLDIRKQLGRSLRQPLVTDKMIIARSNGHMIAFTIDGVDTIVEWDADDIILSDGMFPGMEHIIVGTVACDGGTILVYAMDRLFSGQDVNRVIAHINHDKANS